MDKKDVMYPGPLQEDGTFIGVRIREDQPPQVGQFKKLRDGEPILGNGEIVNLSYEEGMPGLKVTEIYRSGPAQVATKGYRTGWDTTFGSKTNKEDKSQAN